MDFTSWDAGLHTTDKDYLAHYGVGGRLGSMIRKRNYLRQDEKAIKRAAKGKAADRGSAFRERAAQAKARFESGINNVEQVYLGDKKRRRR